MFSQNLKCSYICRTNLIGSHRGFLNIAPVVRQEWIHYALTFDKLTGEIIVYGNGNVLKSEIFGAATESINAEDGKLAIGRLTLDGAGGFYGEATVDDLVFYDRVLNATEVKAIASVYNATMG